MSEGIVSKPGRSGAFTSNDGVHLYDEPAEPMYQGDHVLLKYDGEGEPVYVTKKQYKAIMGEPRKQRSKRKPRGYGKGKKR